MKYSMKEIRMSLSLEKKREDSVFAILFHRPLSYPVTYFFVNAGVTAWTVSIISAVVALVGCALLCVNTVSARWVGLVLLNIWAILDCVDGNVARVSGTQSKRGSFMDAESGYIMCAFVYFSFGVAAYQINNGVILSDQVLYVVFGAIASISDILSRLVHQKYVSTVEEGKTADVISKSKVGSIRKRVSTELGIAGFVLFGGILAQLLNRFDILVLFYFAFCVLTLLATISIYSIKARRG